MVQQPFYLNYSMTQHRAQYICIEGTEGCYKTTNTRALANALEQSGYKVLQTKEPGTSHIPLTMELRGIMLDKKHDAHLTVRGRELVSQAIRSVHLEKLVSEGLNNYDYIIQDRGLLSGMAYGVACGNLASDILMLVEYITHKFKPTKPGFPAWNIYDKIIFLKGDTEKGLQQAQAAKQEFAAGDNIEARGLNFMMQVEANFSSLIDLAAKARVSSNIVTIDVTAKTPQVILTEILGAVMHESWTSSS